MTPEEKARLEIDQQLIEAGWSVQDKSAINLSAARGVAIRGASLRSGHVGTDGFQLSTECVIGLPNDLFLGDNNGNQRS